MDELGEPNPERRETSGRVICSPASIGTLK